MTVSRFLNAGFRPRATGDFCFGKSHQNHSPGARVAEAATFLRALLAAESRSRHFPLRILLRGKAQGAHPVRPLEAALLAPVPVARARHPWFRPRGLTLLSPVLGSRYGYPESRIYGSVIASKLQMITEAVPQFFESFQLCFRKDPGIQNGRSQVSAHRKISRYLGK